MGNNNFKLKLIFPCRLEPNNLDSYFPFHYPLFHYLHLPYGMGILTAFLRKHNYYVEQEDLPVKFNRHNSASFFLFKNDLDIDRYLKAGDIEGRVDLYIDKILNSISVEGFNLIGFSVFTYYHFCFAILLAKGIKQKINIPIAFGGPFISLSGHLYPELFNFIDYMIVGDGRVPLLKLIDYLKNKTSISEVPNLIYKDNGKVISNLREDYPLEDIPIPDFYGLPLELYKRPQFGDSYSVVLPYQISKGCTSKCSFCNFTVIGRKLEFKSYNKVVSELEQMKERYNSKMFHFCDDAINNSYEHLEGLCNLFIKNELNINWAVYAKVGNLDRYILRKMKEAGCRWLSFGIESGSDNILRRMNKGFTSEQASRTLRDASEAGLTNTISLIVGYPHETQEDIKQTTDFIRKNKKYINHIRIFRFEMSYGSPIYFNPESHSITNLTSIQSQDYFVQYFLFTFDELSGLKWEQKQKQQRKSHIQIIKAVYKNARFKRKVKFLRFCCLTLFRHIIVKIKKVCHLI